MKYHGLLATTLLCVFATQVMAQSVSRKKEEFIVAHRLQQWHTEHFEDATKSQQHTAALKQLGAEIRTDGHEGHFDVTYRSVGWKPLRVDSDELAHQWEGWLKAAGFETLHGHRPGHEEDAHHEPAGHGHKHGPGEQQEEIVLYRASAWASQHFEDAVKAEELFTVAQALRCEVQKAGHEGHTDIRFVCPEWTEIEFPDHETAEAWMNWLTTAGFEVQHDDDHK